MFTFKLKEFIEEVKETIKWLLAGCPKPVKIPIRIRDEKKTKRS